MADSLIISGGGSTAVAVDHVFAQASALEQLTAVLGDWSDRASRITSRVTTLDSDSRRALFGQLQTTLSRCRVELSGIRDEVVLLRFALLASAEVYGAVERRVDALWDLGTRLGSWWLGANAGALTALGLAGAAYVGPRALLVRALLGPERVDAAIADLIRRNRGLLSDPAFVALVRHAGDAADEFAVGMLHLPSGLGAGMKAPENASVLLTLASFFGLAGSRMLVEGPVTVSRVEPSAAARAADPTGSRTGSRVPPPSGIGDLADRVPSPADGDAQIRIERYGAPGDERYVVYIGGTVDARLIAGEQPFDMSSNTHGIADDADLAQARFAGSASAAGERAVRQALDAAGVRATDPVLAVGYSGGGIVAAALASDPSINTVAAINLGGPVASAATRDGVPLLSLEHVEDLVPATGGSGQPADERLIVSRRALERGREYDGLLPAHELARYRETAALVDASEAPSLAALSSMVGEFAGGRPGVASEWIARRDVSPATAAR